MEPIVEDRPGVGKDNASQTGTRTAVAGSPAIDKPDGDPPGSGASLPGSDSVNRAPGAIKGPEELMGLTSNALTRLIGSPSLVRHEAPAQIWQYRQTSCVFDIFLYEEAGELRVAYFEARDHKAQKQAPGPCFSEVIERPELSLSG